MSTMVVYFSVRVEGIDDPDSIEANEVIEELTLDLKGALEGWEWSLDDAEIAEDLTTTTDELK